MELPHRLERTVTIDAPRETVFRYFTDSQRWASWWGAGSAIEPRPRGRMYIRHPNGVEVAGEVVEIAIPERIVFTYGYVGGTPMPPGASRVSIRLEEDRGGTRLHLTHEFADAAARDAHVQGWRYQLSVFGNVVANELHAGAADLVDAWFEAWAEPDEQKRRDTLERIAAPDVRFRNAFSLLEGIPDVTAHIAAALRFMPGMRLRREGQVRHCQGTALADWSTVTNDGQKRGSGSSVFLLGPDRRIAAVTGLQNPS